MRQVKKPVAVVVNAKLQRTSKAPVERYRIHVIDRAAQILDCFGFDHQELSVSEIGAKTGLHRSTAHRILMALEYNDLIKQNRIPPQVSTIWESSSLNSVTRLSRN